MRVLRPGYVRFNRYLKRGIPRDKIQSLLLEEDHTASFQHDEQLVAPVSREAHQRLERNRGAAGVERKRQGNKVKTVMWCLRSCAVFLELLSEAMWRWSDLLEKEES